MVNNSIRKVAVVGSGVAGLTCAIGLQAAGAEVRVFEKSRGPGGRLSSKRVAQGSVDVGAQYFTVRSSAFADWLEREVGAQHLALWQGCLMREQDGTLQPWRDEPRYVGVPRMTAISRILGEKVAVAAECRIDRIEEAGAHWYLQDTQNHRHGPFDAVIITAPPAQARDMVRHIPSLQAPLAGFEMLPVWAVAARFDAALALPFDGVRLTHPVLEWVARDSSKPGRTATGEWWVLHAAPGWSSVHAESDPATVIQSLLDAFRERFDMAVHPQETLTHRWLYAQPAPGDQPGYLWDAMCRVGFCGDWLNGGRVEGAFESARQLVAALSR